MVTKLDKIKWELWKKKNELLIRYGASRVLVRKYEDELIENLRHVYYGGIPASIILLCPTLCEGRCYDRALLMTLGFGDDAFKLVDADVDMIALDPRYIDAANEHYANHCFAERTMKDGMTWVYDTTLGFICEKNLYYIIQHPRITKINEKAETIAFCEYRDIKNADIERDKYALPITLPNLEAIVASEERGLYVERLRYELELFKEQIGYDDICRELEEDKKRPKGYAGGQQW